MKNLKAYVDQKNRWDMIFGAPALVIGLHNQRIAENIDSDLIRKRYAELTAAARELKQLDPTVKFYEYSE